MRQGIIFTGDDSQGFRNALLDLVDYTVNIYCGNPFVPLWEEVEILSATDCDGDCLIISTGEFAYPEHVAACDITRIEIL